MFAVAYTTAALKSRKRLPRNLRNRITAKIEEVAADPTGQHPQVKPLVGIDALRLRVGDWRVLFELDHANKVLLVLDIRHRSEAYQ
jgi:mRNA interferase RelE/StbE